MKQLNKKEKPLVDKKYLLQKKPCKGAWTYTKITEILPDKHSPFGWVKVKGSIDGYEIKDYHLMPTEHRDNKLFLFVNAKIRKAIKKEAGDYIHVVLYLDNDPLEIPEELLLCLQEEPEALQLFNSLSESEQHKYVKWIYSAKTDETKVKRIVETIDKLLKR
jgi:Uncharacterized protein conserved in bacteria